MAKSQASFTFLFALLFYFLLIASTAQGRPLDGTKYSYKRRASLGLCCTEMPMAEAKVCSRRSRTRSGVCLNSGNCNRQCKNWEGAQHGACHTSDFGFACFCYFKC